MLSHIDPNSDPCTTLLPHDSARLFTTPIYRRTSCTAAAAGPPQPFPTSMERGTVRNLSDTGFAAELLHPGTKQQEAWQFFASRVPTHKRHHNLMRALLRHLEAPQQPVLVYRELWSSHTEHIFSRGSSAESRISRLFRGRRLIEREHQRFECASRLSLVFLSHDIEVVKSQDWKLGPGQSRQHAAVLSVAQHLGVEPNEIKREWRRSRNYMILLETCGPGSLLELGTGVNW